MTPDIARFVIVPPPLADFEVREFTALGTGITRRRPRRLDIYRQLEAGPFLAAFDAGVYEELT